MRCAARPAPRGAAGRFRRPGRPPQASVLGGQPPSPSLSFPSRPGGERRSTPGGRGEAGPGWVGEAEGSDGEVKGGGKALGSVWRELGREAMCQSSKFCAFLLTELQWTSNGWEPRKGTVSHTAGKGVARVLEGDIVTNGKYIDTKDSTLKQE